jgi:hypothetical protein
MGSPYYSNEYSEYIEYSEYSDDNPNNYQNYNTNNTNNTNNSNNSQATSKKENYNYLNNPDLIEMLQSVLVQYNGNYINCVNNIIYTKSIVELRKKATQKRYLNKVDYEKYCHNYGIGLYLIDKDVKRAHIYLVKSAEKNNVFSMYCLGVINETANHIELATYYYANAINNGIVQMCMLKKINNYEKIIMKMVIFYWRNKEYFNDEFDGSIGRLLIKQIIKYGNLCVLIQLFNYIRSFDIEYGVFSVFGRLILDFYIDVSTCIVENSLIEENFEHDCIYIIFYMIYKFKKFDRLKFLSSIKKYICTFLLLNKKYNIIDVNFIHVYSDYVEEIKYIFRIYPLELSLFCREHNIPSEHLNKFILRNNINLQFALNRYNIDSIVTDCQLCYLPKKKCIKFLCSCDFRVCISCYSHYIYRSNPHGYLNIYCPHCKLCIFINE